MDKESGFVGGLVGRVVGTAEGSNNALTDVTIDGFYAARRGSASIDAVAGVSGTSTLTATETNVTVNKKCLIGPACANDDMKNALTEDIENLNVYLAGDVTVAFSSTSFFYGGDNTSVVTFNGNGHKLTIDSSYRQWMKAKNANAKLVKTLLNLCLILSIRECYGCVGDKDDLGDTLQKVANLGHRVLQVGFACVGRIAN